MDEMSELLRRIFETEDGLTLSVSGTGSAGMEVGINSLLEPGDTVIMCVCGFFGHRMEDMAERIGANVVVLESEWGKPFPAEMLEAELREARAGEAGHHRARGDVHGRAAAAQGRVGAGAGARRAVHGRRRDLAGRQQGRVRRRGHRLLLLGVAEVPGHPARHGARRGEPAGAGVRRLPA